MKENLEKELNNWKREYLKEKEKVEKEYQTPSNALSNRNPLEELNKKFMKMKKQILKKYGVLK